MTWSREQVYVACVRAMALVSAGWHFWAARQQTWFIDDWIYLDRVQTYGFWQYVFQDYNGHIEPGEFLLMWVLTKVAPMNYLPTALIAGALWVGAVLAWGSAFRETFGPRYRLLLPLVVIAFSPMLLWPSLFWAGRQTIPLMLFMGLAALYAARVARGERRAEWQLLATYAAALVFWEKALLLVLPIAAVIFFVGGLKIRAHRRLIGLAAAVSLAYVVLYAALRTDPVTKPVVWVDEGQYSFLGRVLRLFDYSIDVARDMVVPSVWGGPWGSIPIVNDLDHVPSPAISWPLAVLSVLLLVAGMLARRRGWIPVAMVLVYAAVATFLILFSTKYAILGPYALYEDRYFADLVPVMMLAIAMLIAPTTAEHESGASPWRVRLPRSLDRLRVPVLVVGGAAVVVSLLVGNVQHWERIGRSPGKDWVDNLRADIARVGTASVHDARPPAEVMDSSYYPDEGYVSRMVASMRHDLTFNGPGSPILLVAGDGHLVPATVGRSIAATTGPQPDCGYLLKGGDEVDVRLPQQLFAYEWGVQFDLFSGEGGTLVVTIDGTRQQAEIPAGSSSVQFVQQGAVSRISAVIAERSRTACLTGVHAGEFLPES